MATRSKVTTKGNGSLKRVPRVLFDRIVSTREWVNRNVFEREKETDGILLSIFSGQNLLFLGRPGTAKTQHIRQVCKMLNLSLFDILLSETTRPEYVFGGPDIPALGKGVQRNKIKGYAPTADVVFFDEVFKANGIVLNPTLRLINEHEYDNGDDGTIKCPLRTTLMASNEIPTDPTLKAFYDRVLLRYEVGYLRDKKNIFRMMDQTTMPQRLPPRPFFAPGDVDEIRRLVKQVVIPNELKHLATKIRDQVQMACNHEISDRRLAQSMVAAQAMAVLDGRMVADIQDLEVLADTFWDKPEQHVKVQSIVLSNTSAEIADVLTYAEQADQIWQNSTKTGDIEQAVENLYRLHDEVKTFQSRTGRQIAGRIKGLIDRAKGVLDQQGSFVIIKVNDPVSQTTWFKLSVASSSVWTKDQLRRAGFHWRIKHQYWWSQLSEKTLVAQITKALAVTPLIHQIGKLKARHQDDDDRTHGDGVSVLRGSGKAKGRDIWIDLPRRGRR